MRVQRGGRGRRPGFVRDHLSERKWGGRDGGLLRLCRRLGGLREVPLLVGVEMVGNWIGLERGGRYLGYSSIPNVRRLDLRR